jgi:hypothetical protein
VLHTMHLCGCHSHTALHLPPCAAGSAMGEFNALILLRLSAHPLGPIQDTHVTQIHMYVHGIPVI